MNTLGLWNRCRTRSDRAIPFRRLRMLVAASSCGIALLIACSGDDESGDLTTRPAGTEGGACLPSGGCDVGLVCKGGKCARADASGVGGASGAGGSGAAGGATGSGGSTSGAGGGLPDGSSTGGASSGGSSAGGSSAGGSSSGGSAGSAGTSSGGDGGTDGGACNGTHPLVDAGARFCAPGQCRCEDTDTCYASAQAARCCQGRMRCFVPDAGIACEGTHPLVDGSARFCEQARCYCPANDACYPSATARACCGEAAQCN